ncbi:MAG: SDR family oxidoreductase [Elusimicrobia bacterium]|nr:SDR family oxidoreductase [Elusimicrobiota bacterium]
MLKGKRIVVTGAGQGIGRAIAEACCREGAVVGANYLTSQMQAKALQERYPKNIRLLPFDVSDQKAVAAAVDRFCEEEGGIDGWVNNAGVSVSGLLPSQEMDAIRRQIDVNLLGAIICSREVVRVMLQQQGGVIVNIGSVVAQRPSRGQSVYAATKGALDSLTRALAVEYGRKGIRVVCVAPGPIETRMIAEVKSLAGDEILSKVPLKRIGKPEEVAELVAFLLSDKSGFITGSVHAIDGGFLAG